MMEASLARRAYWKIREAARSLAKRELVDPVKTADVRGLKIQLGVSNPLEGYRFSSYSDKEPETLDWIDRVMSSESCFLDVGANIGLYSLYSAARHPGIKVIAVEPEALNFTRLCRNIALNAAHSIFPVNAALSKAVELIQIELSSEQAGAALHHLKSLATESKTFKQMRGVLASRLDEWVKEGWIPQPTAIKVDVDGGERDVIAGALQTLRSPMCRHLLIEIEESSNSDEILRWIEEAGFKLSGKSDWSHSTKSGELRNFIFSKNQA